MSTSPLAARFETPGDLKAAPPEYQRFWLLWGEARYFECHEVLEVLWRKTPGSERWFYNGLIHCAVALYQAGRGNAEGAARQFLRAQLKLAPFEPRFGGIEIVALLEYLRRELAPVLAVQNEAELRKLDELRQSLQITMTGHFPLGRTEGKWEDLEWPLTKK